MTGAAAPGFIPKETLSAYQRWEMASLDPGAAGSVRAPGNGNGDATAKATQADELACLRAAAEQEGRATGYRDGMAKAAADTARLAQVLQSLNTAVGEHEQQVADAVLDLSLALARQLAGDALAVRREMLLPVIAGALAQLPEVTQRVRLHLAPADVDLVRTLADAYPGLDAAQLVPDAAIAAGGFRLETEQCEVDATLGARWQRLAGSLGRSYEWLDHA